MAATNSSAARSEKRQDKTQKNISPPQEGDVNDAVHLF